MAPISSTAGLLSAAPPKRFRRRLLVVMLAVGLLPLLAWGLVAERVTQRVFSVSLQPLQVLLGDLDDALGRRADDAQLAVAVRQARLDLAQADLARRSLARLAPRVLALVLVVSGVVLALAGFLLGRSLSRPVEQLAEGMAHYARGDLTHRVANTRHRAPDELQYLIEAFNRLGDELVEQRARLQVSEALAAWQGVARSLAHEIKNPLTGLRMAVARLLRTTSEGSSAEEISRRRDALRLIESEINALLRMAESFSAFARLPALARCPSDVRALVAEVCDLYRPTATTGIEMAEGPSIVAAVDPEQLRQAVGNLIKNAVEASGPEDGPVCVAVHVRGHEVRIEICDDGPGIPAALAGIELARSFRSTKPGGSGLGLPTVAKIVHEHGGSVRLDPLAPHGVRATIVLPLAAPNESAGQPGEGADGPPEPTSGVPR
jgi:two-component system nitrogen regulation sensor histidine kinase NtrY